MNRTRTLVTGATGFIGKWLILELISQGHSVIALMRKPETQLPELKAWLQKRGGKSTHLMAIKGDLSKTNLGLDEEDIKQLTDLNYIFHLGAAMQWDLDISTAREVNVRPVKFLSDIAAQSTNFKRFVQMSGFMINNARRTEELGLANPEGVSDKHWLSLYKRLGSYEASKYESHFELISQLKAKEVPYTVINPGVVIGHSVTGEISQYDSIVAMIHELYKGNLPAIPGTPRDWLPVIPVDYVAKFTAGVITQTQSIGQQYTLIDNQTPDLASMLKILSQHFHVPVVKRRIPVKLLKAFAKMGFERFLPLPSEPLSFISDDQFDVENTQRMATQIGLSLPSFKNYFHNFADFLLMTRFLQDDIKPSAKFINSASGKIYLSGNTEDPDFVLLHGLPLNSESWTSIEKQYPGKTLRIDLPGLGRSTYNEEDFISWLADLLSSMKSKPVLIGHSVGTGIAVDLAHRYPDTLAGAVLISPYFFGKEPAKWMTNQSAFKTITSLLPRNKLLSFIEGEGEGINQAKQQLMLDANSRYFLPAIAFWLNYAWKKAPLFKYQYETLNIPTLLIVGEHDRPKGTKSLPLKSIAGAGHNPQVTHPEEVFRLLEDSDVSKWLRTELNTKIALAS